MNQGTEFDRLGPGTEDEDYFDWHGEWVGDAATGYISGGTNGSAIARAAFVVK